MAHPIRYIVDEWVKWELSKTRTLCNTRCCRDPSGCRGHKPHQQFAVLNHFSRVLKFGEEMWVPNSIKSLWTIQINRLHQPAHREEDDDMWLKHRQVHDWRSTLCRSKEIECWSRVMTVQRTNFSNKYIQYQRLDGSQPVVCSHRMMLQICE